MNKTNFLLNKPIAHRGIHYKYIENTLPAFTEAIKRNYTIELDIRLTKDNEIIVFHDHNLKRIFEINRNIKDLTYEEIKKFKYIKPLKEVLNLINQKVPVIIDIKDSKKIYKPLIKILDTYKGKFTIQSFNPLILYYLKIKRPQYIRGYLIHNNLYSKQILSILKPTYIATNLKNLKNLSKYRKKYILLGYTIKSNKEYLIYKDYADNFIYDINK